MGEFKKDLNLCRPDVNSYLLTFVNNTSSGITGVSCSFIFCAFPRTISIGKKSIYVLTLNLCIKINYLKFYM